MDEIVINKEEEEVSWFGQVLVEVSWLVWRKWLTALKYLPKKAPWTFVKKAKDHLQKNHHIDAKKMLLHMQRKKQRSICNN